MFRPTQAADAETVWQSCAEADAQIVLGLNAYFETLKAFYEKKPDARSRGQKSKL
jgi:hypothetical protein